MLANSARSKGVSTILFVNKGKGDIGVYLNCVKYFTQNSIMVEGKKVAEIPKVRKYEEKIRVKTIMEELNYTYLLSILRLPEVLASSFFSPSSFLGLLNLTTLASKDILAFSLLHCTVILPLASFKGVHLASYF